MHVTQKKSDSDPIFNNPGIDARNQRIQQLAVGVRVLYIDVNEVVCDDQGGLKQELTFDNLHLYGSKYNLSLIHILCGSPRYHIVRIYDSGR